MPQRQAIRDYAKSKGYLDDDITYDNGTVLLKGKRLIDAAPEADGRTYADTRTLDQAYGRYDVQNQQAALRQQSTQPDPELSVYRKTIQDRINRPIQQFSYNQSTDPAYQNAVQQAQANAATAQNNTLANLRARGQGKSSYSETVANQIQQKELGRVTSDVLPQLINQAYQRYMGQNTLENQQTGNMLGLYGTMSNENQQRFSNAYNLMNQQNTMNQQDIVNDRNDTQDQRQKRLDNTAVQQWYQQQYGVPIEAKDDWSLVADQVKGLTPLDMKKYLDQKAIQEAGLTGEYNGAPTLANKQFGVSERQANASIGNMGASNARANESNALARERFDFEKDQARLKNDNQKPETNDIFAEVVGNLDSMTPEERKAFLKGEKQSLIRDLGINGYNSVYGQYFDKYGDPIE